MLQSRRNFIENRVARGRHRVKALVLFPDARIFSADRAGAWARVLSPHIIADGKSEWAVTPGVYDIHTPS